MTYYIENTDTGLTINNTKKPCGRGSFNCVDQVNTIKTPSSTLHIFLNWNTRDIVCEYSSLHPIIKYVNNFRDIHLGAVDKRFSGILASFGH